MSLRANLLNLLKNKELLESQFILGIDLGELASTICYYDAQRKIPEIIDISGGYGRANMPTTLQYTIGSGEWIFGEHAVLNELMGEEISLSNILSKLGSNFHIQIGDEYKPGKYILGRYIRELINGLKNINPKAEVVGIIVSVSDHITDKAKQELSEAFLEAGCAHQVIDFVSHRECALNFHFNARKVSKENLLLVDFGGRELRAGIYEISGAKNSAKANILSYFYDKQLSAGAVDECIKDKFTDIYKENIGIPTANALSQIDIFFYQNKDALFQRNINKKGMKLYYNFVHPPFGYIFTKEDANEIIAPFKSGIKAFLADLFKRSSPELEFGDIATVLCTGGGFEMLWARELIEDLFPDSNIFIHKNPKAVNAYGAAIIAARKLGLQAGKLIEIEDKLQIKKDIGIIIESDGEKQFFPIIERGSFWWQDSKTLRLTVKDFSGEEFKIKLHERDDKGYMADIGSVSLRDLPPSTDIMQISLELSYVEPKTLKVRIEGKGFGKFSKEDGASGEVRIKLAE